MSLYIDFHFKKIMKTIAGFVSITYASFHFRGDDWVNKTSLTLALLLNCLFQARQMSGHVFVC
jgi:hypothetical protein